MLILRPSITLTRRLRVTPGYVAPGPDDHPLAEWCARDFRIESRQLVLFMNPTTTLPIVLEAAPYKTLIERFREFLPRYLADLGWAKARDTLEPIFAEGVEYRRGTDRSNTGMMNQLLLDLEEDCEYGRISIKDLGSLNRRVLETLIGGSRPEGYKYPIERFREWAGITPRPRPKLRLVR